MRRKTLWTKIKVKIATKLMRLALWMVGAYRRDNNE